MMKRTALRSDPDKTRAWQRRSAVAAAENAGPRAPLRKVSAKMAKRLRAYTPVRAAYLDAHPDCEARLPCCTGQAEHVHHNQGRMQMRDGDRLTDDSEFAAVCAACHAFIETSPDALGNRFKKPRLDVELPNENLPV